jgi:superfamily II DNA/RNA helicase
VHRIGRTARAGADGIAISLCDAEEMAFLRDIEKLIRMSLPMTDRRAHPERAEPAPAKAASGRHNSNGHREQQRRRGGNGSGKQPRHGQSHREQSHHGQSHRAQPRNEKPHNDQSQDAGIGAVAFLRRDGATDRRQRALRWSGESRGS